MTTRDAKKTTAERRKRLLYICDWLPPDFGAVGQYSELFAKQMVQEGTDVILAGLTSGKATTREESVGDATLKTIKFHTKSYAKDRFIKRLWWTIKTNTRLVFGLWHSMRWADEILFTGSPPLFLHWIAPLNILLRKKLVYRITDFHPECLMAARERPSMMLNLIYRLTIFWRRRINTFEILGEDQRARLQEIGIPADRIRLKRDPSPVDIQPGTKPLPRPNEHPDKLLLLYSGNWGVAHDIETFIQSYRRHHVDGSGRIVLWLNAVGAAAAKVEAALHTNHLPFVRGTPVPLDELASLLITPDAHLITLLDPFVGFVLPSKVYGCIASQKPVLYIGSTKSDVHLLCASEPDLFYQQCNAGDVQRGMEALEKIADAVDVKRNNR